MGPEGSTASPAGAGPWPGTEGMIMVPSDVTWGFGAGVASGITRPMVSVPSGARTGSGATSPAVGGTVPGGGAPVRRVRRCLGGRALLRPGAVRSVSGISRGRRVSGGGRVVSLAGVSAAAGVSSAAAGVVGSGGRVVGRGRVSSPGGAAAGGVPRRAGSAAGPASGSAAAGSSSGSAAGPGTPGSVSGGRLIAGRTEVSSALALTLACFRSCCSSTFAAATSSRSFIADICRARARSFRARSAA